MGFDQRIRQRVASILHRRGKPVLLRRVTVLDGPAPSPNPPTADRLSVVAAAAAGASAITLHAKGLTGRLEPGDRFVLDGDATVYTITARAIAAAGRFTALPFAPPLAVPVDAGAAVAMGFAADTPVDARIEGFPARLVDGTLIQVGDLQAMIPGAALSAPPGITDKLLIDGVPKSIVAVTPQYAATTVICWRVQAR